MISPTPADMSRKPTPAAQSNKVGWVDFGTNYPKHSGQYWKKLAYRRQQLIEHREADIRALETRLIELEDELATLKKVTK